MITNILFLLGFFVMGYLTSRILQKDYQKLLDECNTYKGQVEILKTEKDDLYKHAAILAIKVKNLQVLEQKWEFIVESAAKQLNNKELEND